jgi:hypothetical protein
LDKLIHWIVTAAGGAVLTWITRYHDPWYSDGWFLNNLQWLLVPAVVALAAAIASLFARGLIAVIVLAVIAAAAFGVLYGQSNQNEQWPLVTWLLHLVVFCAARRHRAGFARLGYVWWRGLSPPASPPSPPSPPSPAPAGGTGP